MADARSTATDRLAKDTDELIKKLAKEPVYVEKYEVAITDDGCSWVELVTGWQRPDGRLDSRREVGRIPIRFSRDMREMARDFAWMLNRARGERIAEGNYVPVT